MRKWLTTIYGGDKQMLSRKFEKLDLLALRALANKTTDDKGKRVNETRILTTALYLLPEFRAERKKLAPERKDDETSNISEDIERSEGSCRP